MEKNAKKNMMAERRRIKDQTERVGLKIDDDNITIGVVLRHIGASQVGVFAVNEINSMLATHVGVGICLFVQERVPPVVPVLCPIYDIHKLRYFNGPVVCTDISSCLQAISSGSKKICHYVSSLEFLDNSIFSGKQIESTFIDGRVKIVTRCEHYRNVIEKEFGISISTVNIPAFGIRELLKITLEE